MYFYVLLAFNFLVVLLCIIHEWRKCSFLTLVSFFIAFKIAIPLVLVANFSLHQMGNSLERAQHYIEQNFIFAYSISSLGVLFFSLGIIVGRGREINKIFYPFYRVVRRPVHGADHRDVLFFVLFVVVGVFSYALMNGAPIFNLRYFAQTNPEVRPILKLAFILAPYGVMISSVLMIKNDNVKDRLFLFIIFVFLVFVLVCSGSRFNVLEPLIIVAAFYFSVSKKKNPFFVLSFLPVVFFVLFYMKEIRLSEVLVGEERESGLLSELVYGGTFNDLRVFSALLGYWDGVYFGFKSYFAGIFSFIPSSIFEFKDEWLFGNIGPRILGLDPELHPGTRPVVFTEPYFSFGVIGVVLSAFIYGIFLKRISMEMSRSIFCWESLVSIYIVYQFFSLLYHPAFFSDAFVSYVFFLSFSILSSLKRTMVRNVM